jgi:hypothetical protein
MKIQSLFVISIIVLYCNAAFAEDTAAVTGLCKDGTSYTGKTKRGACRGHKGVKEWYGDKSSATATGVPGGAPVAESPVAAPPPAAEPAVAAPAPVTPAPAVAQPAPAPAPAVAQPAPAPAPSPAARTAAPATPAAAAPAPAAGSGQVWVNTKSRIYHCEGSKFYGKTKVGEYMDEAAAQAKGFTANRKKACR